MTGMADGPALESGGDKGQALWGPRLARVPMLLGYLGAGNPSGVWSCSFSAKQTLEG